MFIKRHHQPSKISFLSLLLKIASEGASLTSELNWFQSLGPRNEIDFCPFDVLKRGTRKSALVFLSLIVVRAEFCTNSSDRYSGARPLFDLYIMVTSSGWGGGGGGTTLCEQTKHFAFTPATRCHRSFWVGQMKLFPQLPRPSRTMENIPTYFQTKLLSFLLFLPASVATEMDFVKYTREYRMTSNNENGLSRCPREQPPCFHSGSVRGFRLATLDFALGKLHP